MEREYWQPLMNPHFWQFFLWWMQVWGLVCKHTHYLCDGWAFHSSHRGGVGVTGQHSHGHWALQCHEKTVFFCRCPYTQRKMHQRRWWWFLCPLFHPQKATVSLHGRSSKTGELIVPAWPQQGCLWPELVKEMASLSSPGSNWEGHEAARAAEAARHL